MSTFNRLCANDIELSRLRASLREFLRADAAEFGWQPTVDAWLSRWDANFSRRLGAAGFLGMTIPKSYGGQGLGHLHRYVVTEELLAHGAPVAAHWMADRQVAPALLAYGSEEQRSRLLPGIADGTLYFAIGLSEHGAGSDLAAARATAKRIAEGWTLNGTKVWTSGAHLAHYIVVLARTTPTNSERRHDGFSQFLVARESSGLTIDPIVTMGGEHHFNEVVLDDVRVADADVFGVLGDGWHQITAELAFERSGPERILTTTPLILAAIGEMQRSDTVFTAASRLGELAARMVSLRQLSISVAERLLAGESADLQAAMVKDMGTRFEQQSVDCVAQLLEDLEMNPKLEALLRDAWTHRPMFTLRGGTNEVLRGMVARGLGLR
jgi:acyl-CoA dehydrogenase